MIDLYEDKELTRKIPVKDGKFNIDLGTVEVGEMSIKRIYAYNPGPGVLANLEFLSSRDYVIVSGPIGLEEKETAEIEIKIKPPVPVKQGIKTDLTIKGKIIYKPPS